MNFFVFSKWRCSIFLCKKSGFLIYCSVEFLLYSPFAMAVDLPSDVNCPIPHLSPLAIEQSGVDIAEKTEHIVSLKDAQRSVAEAQAIEQFRKNLKDNFGCSDAMLDGIFVTPYIIKSDLESINGARLFIVSDKKTGKVLSYHEESGRCVLELDKKLTRMYIALDNAA